MRRRSRLAWAGRPAAMAAAGRGGTGGGVCAWWGGRGVGEGPAAAVGHRAGEGGPAGGGMVPVLPDAGGRGRERALARFGLLGEGAAPVFVPGARYPLAGLLLA